MPLSVSKVNVYSKEQESRVFQKGVVCLMVLRKLYLKKSFNVLTGLEKSA